MHIPVTPRMAAALARYRRAMTKLEEKGRQALEGGPAASQETVEPREEGKAGRAVPIGRGGRGEEDRKTPADGLGSPTRGQETEGAPQHRQAMPPRGAPVPRSEEAERSSGGRTRAQAARGDE
jgi:hypothetical protein